MKITLTRGDIDEALKLYLESKYNITIERFSTTFRYWDHINFDYKSKDIDEVIITPWEEE